ncbi:MAG: Fur family transcriptional regulator [Dehalococcoidia bacterium]|nr:Fur family transcriptional regulator [Dehalococcoidia bacterium]
MSDLENVSLKLEALGYRVTPSRRAVIAAVLQQSDHFSVDDVLHRCRGAGRATVFRTIRLLTDLGVVCRLLLADGSLHYRVSQRGHHHHLVCTACGTVRDLDQCAISDLMRELSDAYGYEIEGHWLELYGRCSACRSAVAAEAR